MGALTTTGVPLPKDKASTGQVKRSSIDSPEKAQADSIEYYKAAVHAFLTQGKSPPPEILKAIELRLKVHATVDLSYRLNKVAPALTVDLPKIELTDDAPASEILARHVLDISNQYVQGAISADQKRELSLLPLKILETIPKGGQTTITSINRNDLQATIAVMQPNIGGGFTRTPLEEKYGALIDTYTKYKRRTEHIIDYIKAMLLKSEKELTSEALDQSIETYLIKKGAQ